MSRLKRTAAFEARRRRDSTYVDPGPVAVALFEVIELNAAAVQAGKAEWIAVYGPEPEPSPALAAAAGAVRQAGATA
jgi:hypothetical protein